METKVKEILLRAKKAVFTGNLGNNLTAFKGDGIDFAEIREYNFGDDVRKINWKATAKTGEVKVNEFNEERELNISLVFMVDGGINFGTVALKQDIMAELMAMVSYSAISNGDRLNTLFFSDKLERKFKPSKNLGVVEEYVRSALEINPIGKKADYSALCDFLNSTFKQKSIVIIIGDFYGDIDLSTIAHKHQVYALIVRDRFEEYPAIDGEYTLIDPATLKGEDIMLSKSSAKAFKKELEKQDAKLYEHFLEHRVNYGKIYTDEELYIRLLQIFGK